MIKQVLFSQRIKLNKNFEKLEISQSDNSGFTIVESLMAIVVVAILMAAIAPVIALSVATRVQARRVELATQSARTYIDGVRAGTIAAPNDVVTLSEDSSSGTFSPQRSGSSGFAATSAPTSSALSCSSNAYCTNSTTVSLFCVDFDNSSCANTSTKDMVVQAFRSQTITTVTSINTSGQTTTTTTTSTPDQGYVLAVRVYRADSFGRGLTLKAMSSSNSSYTYKQNPYAGGTGDRVSPLVEFTTEITTQNTQFQDYCTRYGGCS
jgi:prepilin-type N-terminal cleavage/methylation domain-containing protein